MNKLSVRWMAGAVVALIALCGVGCVSQAELDRTRELYRNAIQENEDLKEDLRAARATIEALRQSVNLEKQQLADQLAAAQMRIEELELALDQARKALENAKIGVLPEELNKDLRDFAAQHPGLMTYDERLGMIRLNSDLTFDLGSDVVSAQAQQALQQLAGILNGGLASSYQLQVVGHTDNVPINRVRDKHPTNWHLSAHRAISVKNVLSDAGVNQARFTVAGRGEFEPIEPNPPSGGNRANRRVEIFLIGRRYDGGPGATRTGETGTPAPVLAPAPTEPEDSFK